MHFTSNLIFSFLLASVTLAGPGLEPRGPPIEYSDTDAGVILRRGDKTVYIAIAEFVVPHITSDDGSDASVSVWVGLDDDSCGHALRAGVLMKVSNGVPTYKAFSQHYPHEDPMYYPNQIIAAGDNLRLLVEVPVAEEPTVGYATVINHNRSNPPFPPIITSTIGPFCMQSAEWIVQKQAGVPLANFGTTLQLTNVMAFDANLSSASYVLTEGNVIVTDVDEGPTVFYPPDQNSFTVRYPQGL